MSAHPARTVLGDEIPELVALRSLQESSLARRALVEGAERVANDVTAAVWRNAVRMLDAPDIQHAACDEGGCNLCILDTFSMALGRRGLYLDLMARKRAAEVAGEVSGQ